MSALESIRNMLGTADWVNAFSRRRLYESDYISEGNSIDSTFSPGHTDFRLTSISIAFLLVILVMVIVLERIRYRWWLLPGNLGAWCCQHLGAEQRWTLKIFHRVVITAPYCIGVCIAIATTLYAFMLYYTWEGSTWGNFVQGRFSGMLYGGSCVTGLLAARLWHYNSSTLALPLNQIQRSCDTSPSTQAEKKLHYALFALGLIAATLALFSDAFLIPFGRCSIEEPFASQLEANYCNKVNKEAWRIIDTWWPLSGSWVPMTLNSAFLVASIYYADLYIHASHDVIIEVYSQRAETRMRYAEKEEKEDQAMILDEIRGKLKAYRRHLRKRFIFFYTASFIVLIVLAVLHMHFTGMTFLFFECGAIILADSFFMAKFWTSHATHVFGDMQVIVGGMEATPLAVVLITVRAVLFSTPSQAWFIALSLACLTGLCYATWILLPSYLAKDVRSEHGRALRRTVFRGKRSRCFLRFLSAFSREIVAFLLFTYFGFLTIMSAYPAANSILHFATRTDDSGIMVYPAWGTYLSLWELGLGCILFVFCFGLHHAEVLRRPAVPTIPYTLLLLLIYAADVGFSLFLTCSNILPASVGATMFIYVATLFPAVASCVWCHRLWVDADYVFWKGDGSRRDFIVIFCFIVANLTVFFLPLFVYSHVEATPVRIAIPVVALWSFIYGLLAAQSWCNRLSLWDNTELLILITLHVLMTIVEAILGSTLAFVSPALTSAIFFGTVIHDKKRLTPVACISALFCLGSAIVTGLSATWIWDAVIVVSLVLVLSMWVALFVATWQPLAYKPFVVPVFIAIGIMLFMLLKFADPFVHFCLLISCVVLAIIYVATWYYYRRKPYMAFSSLIYSSGLLGVPAVVYKVDQKGGDLRVQSFGITAVCLYVLFLGQVATFFFSACLSSNIGTVISSLLYCILFLFVLHRSLARLVRFRRKFTSMQLQNFEKVFEATVSVAVERSIEISQQAMMASWLKEDSFHFLTTPKHNWVKEFLDPDRVAPTGQASNCVNTATSGSKDEFVADEQFVIHTPTQLMEYYAFVQQAEMDNEQHSRDSVRYRALFDELLVMCSAIIRRSGLDALPKRFHGPLERALTLHQEAKRNARIEMCKPTLSIKALQPVGWQDEAFPATLASLCGTAQSDSKCRRLRDQSNSGFSDLSEDNFDPDELSSDEDDLYSSYDEDDYFDEDDFDEDGNLRGYIQDGSCRVFDEDEVTWCRASVFSSSGFEVTQKPLVESGHVRIDVSPDMRYDPRDVVQGSLGDCWLLSSISVVALWPALMEKVLPEPYQTDKNGRFSVRLFVDGEWKSIDIDDRLPCFNSRSWSRNGVVYENRAANPSKALLPLPIACRSRKPSVIWPMLLEKAFAKTYGSYDALCGGHVHTALVDLTGGLTQVFQLKQDIELVASLALWKRLKRFREERLLLAAGTHEKDDEDRSTEDLGITPGHAYAVLDVAEEVDSRGLHRLLKLRDPWGTCQWRGRWNDRDSENWTQRMRKRLCNNEQGESTSAGSKFSDFWICMDDFVVQFKEVYVCRVFHGEENRWKPIRVTGLFRSRFSTKKYPKASTRLLSSNSGSQSSSPSVFQPSYVSPPYMKDGAKSSIAHLSNPAASSCPFPAEQTLTPPSSYVSFASVSNRTEKAEIQRKHAEFPAQDPPLTSVQKLEAGTDQFTLRVLPSSGKRTRGNVKVYVSMTQIVPRGKEAFMTLALLNNGGKAVGVNEQVRNSQVVASSGVYRDAREISLETWLPRNANKAFTLFPSLYSDVDVKFTINVYSECEVEVKPITAVANENSQLSMVVTS